MKSFDGIIRINTKKNNPKNSTDLKKSSVRDLEKRKFLKIAGIAGIGALAYSFIPKKAHAVIFGSSMRTDSVGVKNITGTQVNPATEETLQGLAGLLPISHDYISRNWNGEAFTEIWTFKTGGSAGTIVGAITIVYDDVNQSNIVSVTKT